MFACIYCKKSFSSKANLYTHEKSAKYCIKTRPENITAKSHICDICGKSYSQYINLKNHYQKCTNKSIECIKDENIKELTQTIGELTQNANSLLTVIEEYKQNEQKHQKQNERLKSKNSIYRKLIKTQKEEITNLRIELNREQGILIGYKESKPPTIVTQNNNTIINNKLKMVPTSKIRPFTQELIEANSETYTYDHFVDGKDGLISHLLQTTVFEDEDGRIHKNYVCTNRARNTFHILLAMDDWKLDPGAYEIHNYLDSLRPFVEEHYKQFKIFSNGIKYGDPLYDVQYYKELEIKLLDFTKAFREGPCDANREKLLKSVRTGIKKRLSI